MACGCRAKAYEAGCHKLSCRTCEVDLRARRAASIRDRFEGPGGRQGRAVIYTILTVPPHRREAAADYETWRKWMRSIIRFMKREFGLAFAVMRTDPCGDSDRTLWHPHANILWVQRDGFRPFIDRLKLRDAWARVVGADVVNVWTQYSARDRQLGHWYWYMGRTFPEWAAAEATRKHLPPRWYGAFPKKAPPPDCCPDCGQGWVFLDVGLEAEARALAAAGPEAVRWEVEKSEMARVLARAGPL